MNDQELFQPSEVTPPLSPSGSMPAPRPLAGATAGAEAEPETELPLVVWLRGDEPHVPDFCLDAEQVMAELGIRRSRLTQISGRELRVGRIRRGRYVAPVYRPEDVATYKSWTRATASHVKSSALLSEAATALRDESSRAAEAVLALEQRLANTAEQAVRGGVAELARLVREPLLAALAALQNDADVRAHALRRLEQAQAAEADRLAALAARVDAQTAALMVLSRDVAELAAVTRLDREAAQLARQQAAERLLAVSRQLQELGEAQQAAMPAPLKPRQERRRAADARRLEQQARLAAAPAPKRQAKPARARPSRQLRRT